MLAEKLNPYNNINYLYTPNTYSIDYDKITIYTNYTHNRHYGKTFTIFKSGWDTNISLNLDRYDLQTIDNELKLILGNDFNLYEQKVSSLEIKKDIQTNYNEYNYINLLQSLCLSLNNTNHYYISPNELTKKPKTLYWGNKTQRMFKVYSKTMERKMNKETCPNNILRFELKLKNQAKKKAGVKIVDDLVKNKNKVVKVFKETASNVLEPIQFDKQQKITSDYDLINTIKDTTKDNGEFMRMYSIYALKKNGLLEYAIDLQETREKKNAFIDKVRLFNRKNYSTDLLDKQVIYNEIRNKMF